ncbi:hypothetical protein IGI84_000539 [Enterococcus sp. DIV0008]|uniref:GGDEF domain-containing protein n=1 Tax=unclassified Enterococcus TaxID=2608891 RepID=UPI003D2FCAC1
MIIHLIYTAMYAILVVSLLISYDLFIKNFKELNLRLSFKILIGIVLFISQVYFIISFSLNSIGYVAYEYTIPIFIYYFGVLKEKIYLVGLVPVILLTFFALINKFDWQAMFFIIGLNYAILIVTYSLKKIFYGKANHTFFYLFSILVTVGSPMVDSGLFYRREIGFGDVVFLGIGSGIILFLWKYYLHNQKNFLEKINTKIIERNYDELTKIKNFRSLNEDISKLTLIEKNQLIVGMLDLDHFKQINDHYGHQIGNQALTFFAEKLTTFLDQKIEDPSLVEVYRYGGEEFLVLFRGHTLSEVKNIIEEFHSFLRKEQLNLDAAQLTLYFSAGISKAEPALDISETFYQADQALYEAKRKGRNRTIIFS